MADDAEPREWFTAAELAGFGLPGVAATKSGIIRAADGLGWTDPEAEGRTWRRRQGRGGGIEYRITCLPMAAQAKLRLRFTPKATSPVAIAKRDLSRDALWEWWGKQTQKKKDEGARRLKILQSVEMLMATGVTKKLAVDLICGQADIGVSSYYRWEAMVRGYDKHDWLAVLAPRHAGAGPEQAECSPEAWDKLRRDWLRPEKPDFADCYRMLLLAAKERGWTVPSARTMERRLNAIPHTTKVLMREGMPALKRMLPAQKRDHSVFHALQAVNLDDHRMDVFVKWPDGSIGRPHLMGVQDIYSGMILAWRIDRSENTQAIRLAIHDVVEEFGIPEIFWFDNTRAAANKAITGGQPNRFRFKAKEEDPAGLIELLQAEVRFTMPYSGQSKTIERKFRDVATSWAKDIRFAGAYTGNSPMAKPDNYGSKAIPLAKFIEVIAERYEEDCTRLGRRSDVCAGRSHRQAFDESYANAAGQGLIRKATQEQRHLFLLQAEKLKIRTDVPAIHFHDNRYFAPWMTQMPGASVVGRFDADALHDDMHIYALDGRYLGAAECQHAVGFNSVAAAREYARKTRALLRAHRDMAELELRMTLEQAAAQLPKIEKAAPAPETKVVQMLPRIGNTALKRAPDELEDDLPASLREQTDALNVHFLKPRPQRDE